jgi:glutamate racemase
VPYGPKSPQVVREYAAQDADFLLSHGVKMIVIACNTVSAVAPDVVKKRAKVPVVGVIYPGAGAAAAATARKRVGVIGTLATIGSGAYAHALRQLDPGITVFSSACPLLVPLAEEGWIDHPATQLIAREYLFPLKLEKIDTLILGCTHYPVLRSAIGAVMDAGVALIDSGEAAALEVGRVLDAEGLRNGSRQQANLKFFVSDLPAKFIEIGERFLGEKMGRVQRVSGF